MARRVLVVGAGCRPPDPARPLRGRSAMQPCCRAPRYNMVCRGKLSITAQGEELSGDDGFSPRRLSHYTTLAGLMGIIESGQIWASNVKFLNDSRELDHGLEASREAIDIILKKRRSLKVWHEALKHASGELEQGKIPNTYAACFCARADILSQWRGYGGMEQGVSITFTASDLERRMRQSKAEYCRVIYGNVTAANKMLASLSSELDIFEDVVGIRSEEHRKEAAYTAVCRLIPRFKHLGFGDEREWRFVVQHANIREDVCFRSNRNLIVPYVKLLGGGDKLPIEYITIGPGRDPDLTARSVRVFLAKHGYDLAKVKISKVPYRT